MQYSCTTRLWSPFSLQHLQKRAWLFMLKLKMVADGHFPSQENTVTWGEETERDRERGRERRRERRREREGERGGEGERRRGHRV